MYVGYAVNGEEPRASMLISAAHAHLPRLLTMPHPRPAAIPLDRRSAILFARPARCNAPRPVRPLLTRAREPKVKLNFTQNLVIELSAIQIATIARRCSVQRDSDG